MTDLIGGLIPLVRTGRDRHVVETTWWFELAWFRSRLRVEVCR